MQGKTKRMCTCKSSERERLLDIFVVPCKENCKWEVHESTESKRQYKAKGNKCQDIKHNLQI